MTSGIYQHKENQGFQKGHKICVGRFKNGNTPYKQTDKAKADLINARKNYRERIRNETLEILGGVCKNCGFSDKRALQVDHIHGGGNKERKEKLFNSLSAIKKDILENPEKYQLLCANCNVIKRIVNKEHRK